MKKTSPYPILIGITALALVVLTSAVTVDWMNFSCQTGSIYSFYAKPAVTLLSLVLVLAMRKHSIKGWGLLG